MIDLKRTPTPIGPPEALSSMPVRANHSRDRSIPMRRLLAFTAAILFSLLTAPPLSAQDVKVDIEGTRNVLEQWIETKRLISKEEQKLKFSKEMLGERIELVQREIDSLKTKIDEAEGSIAEAEKKREDLVSENEKLKAASASLADILSGLELNLKNMLPRLPEPLRDRIKPLTQRLPKNSAETKLSISERFQNVVGVLNEIDKFNREITVISEVRQLPDGTSAEVTSLYLGIGQGYYTGAGGKIGGIGYPTDEGWAWQPADSVGPKVAHAIAIINNEQVADFVQLPVKIQ